MAKRIKFVGKRQSRIVNTSPEQPKTDPAVIAKALGAEIISTGGRQGFGILAYLASTGGRPSLVNTPRRQKIPLSEADWQKLVRLAVEASTEERKISPGQVAALILRAALTDTSPTDEQVKRWLYDRHPGASYDAAVATAPPLKLYCAGCGKTGEAYQFGNDTVAPNGPECHCGDPSAVESGCCARCAMTVPAPVAAESSAADDPATHPYYCAINDGQRCSCGRL